MFCASVFTGRCNWQYFQVLINKQRFSPKCHFNSRLAYLSLLSFLFRSIHLFSLGFSVPILPSPSQISEIDGMENCDCFLFTWIRKKKNLIISRLRVKCPLFKIAFLFLLGYLRLPCLWSEQNWEVSIHLMKWQVCWWHSLRTSCQQVLFFFMWWEKRGTLMAPFPRTVQRPSLSTAVFIWAWKSDCVCITTSHDWLKNLAPLFYLIISILFFFH